MNSIRNLLLNNKWLFNRTIQHHNNSNNIINVYGNAIWSILNTNNNDNNAIDLLYREDGVMKLNNNNNDIKVHQQYIYNINHNNNNITIYFTDINDNTKRGNLFHELIFDNTSNNNNNIYKSTSNHLCIQDYYNGKYIFDTINNTISIEYNVNGPNKDYTSITKYTIAIEQKIQ